jgi:hypothetical protein
VSNAAGIAGASWQVTLTYAGSYIDVGTMAYHLSTNAAGYASGRSGSSSDMLILANWSYAQYSATNLALLTNAVWSTNFWLHGVQGLSATAIGYSNGFGAQGLVTMVSPRHYLFATHVHPEDLLVAFLDTNNVLYWRTTLQRVDVANDTSVGILNADLPASVGFMPVVPTNLSSYVPTNATAYVQGIGMNQDGKLFGQPMNFADSIFVGFNSLKAVPFGLGTNWNIAIRVGDSSDPEMFLVGNQLVLVTHNYTGGTSGTGPNYSFQVNGINQAMHYLSTNNTVGSDYQLITFSLTNWPTIH